jgi:hypothetical protein
VTWFFAIMRGMMAAGMGVLRMLIVHGVVCRVSFRGMPQSMFVINDRNERRVKKSPEKRERPGETLPTLCN